MGAMVLKLQKRHNEKIDLCPLFTGTGAPLVNFDTENAAIGTSGFRHVLQMAQSELLKRMN
jgi:hypothetical protein